MYKRTFAVVVFCLVGMLVGCSKINQKPVESVVKNDKNANITKVLYEKCAKMFEEGEGRMYTESVMKSYFGDVGEKPEVNYSDILDSALIKWNKPLAWIDVNLDERRGVKELTFYQREIMPKLKLDRYLKLMSALKDKSADEIRSAVMKVYGTPSDAKFHVSHDSYFPISFLYRNGNNGLVSFTDVETWSYKELGVAFLKFNAMPVRLERINELINSKNSVSNALEKLGSYSAVMYFPEVDAYDLLVYYKDNDEIEPVRLRYEGEQWTNLEKGTNIFSASYEDEDENDEDDEDDYDTY